MRNVGSLEKYLRETLRPGDIIEATRAECFARRSTYVFRGWDGGWIISKRGHSIAPCAVHSINGDVLGF